MGIEQQFTAPERFNLFPQAHFHTQWPGSGPNKGQAGDPIFDQFFASQVESIPTQAGTSETLVKAAGAALLDRIGPAILLTHSQAGAYGWQIADARPQAVKAILAVEPAVAPTIPESPSSLPKYGITTTPITFSPAIHDASDIVHVVQTTPDAPDLALCWTQGEPVRQLPNLHGIPILIVVSQASPVTSKDQCVSRFLAQAGVENTMIRLPDIGIFGNGHMMMLEKNSDQIAHVLADWLQGRLL